jgi:signal transduction histidine kinase
VDLSPKASIMLRASVITLTAVVGLPIATRLWNGEEPLGARAIVWIVAFLAFLTALFVGTGGASNRRILIAAYVVQSTAIPLLIALVDHGYSFAASLLAAVTGQVVVTLGRRAAVWWSVAQSIAAVAVFAALWRPVAALTFSIIYIAIQLFTLLMTSVAVEEAALRSELSVINAELRATRQLVADSSRSTERIRIARELHDVAGHHLTALTLNLESARHRIPEDARADVDAAIRTSRQLLAEIRNEVSALRDNGGIRFDRALGTLAAGVKKPRVSLALQDDITIADGERALQLLRCVQEIITNSARHGGSDTLEVRVTQTDDAIDIVARDRGRGAASIVEGNGLRGMRERIELLGGTIRYESSPGQGFTVEIHAPSA